MRKNIREFLEFLAPNLEAKRVLEIGSLQVEGQEHLSNLRPLFPKSTFLGSDIRKGKGVDIIQDAHNLAIKDSFIDLVLCIDTLEHVLDPWTAIKEFKRVLSENGILVISSVMDFPIHDYPNDYWRFTPEIFLEFVKDLRYKKIFFQGDFLKPDTLIAIGARKELKLEFPERIAGRDLFEYCGSTVSTEETKTEWLPPIVTDERSLDFLKRLLKEVAKIIPTGAKVLDIGCSSGLCVDILLKRSCTVYGLAMDKYTYRSLFDRYAHMIPLERVDDLEEKFDIVLILDLQTADLFPVAGARKFLEDGGFLILSVPNPFHVSFILEILKNTPGILDRLIHVLEELPVVVEDMIRVEVKTDEVWYKDMWLQLPEDFRIIANSAADISTYRIILKCRLCEEARYRGFRRSFLKSFSEFIKGLENLSHQKRLLEEEYSKVIESKSWRLTEPFRRLRKLLKNLLK